MSISDFMQKYAKWPEREKWLLLRDVAYRNLRESFFKSPRSIENISYTDFAKHYLGFCTIWLRGSEYKLTVNTISDFLEKYTVSELQNLTSEGKLKVVGNASWSQLHMGTKKEKWEEIKKAISLLLFGDSGEPLERIEESEVLDRLRLVMEGSMSVDGFGRAKITPLLLICDSRKRFGVWNSVSDSALHKMGLKTRSDMTKSRSVSHYEMANKALKELKNNYAFKDLSDVDIFVWYYLDQPTSAPPPEKPSEAQPKPSLPQSLKVRANPLISTATFSLMNALEFFQGAEERHRQGAMILMDQAAEYILKAKLYEVDHVRFMAGQLERLEFEQTIQEVEKHAQISGEEKFHLRKVHSARNYAQHRAVIPDSSWTREYMNWIYSFARRFTYDNFGISIDSLIPSSFRKGV
jgi:hypothetical protein